MRSKPNHDVLSYYRPEDAIVDAQKVCERCVELAVKHGAKYVKDVEVVGLVKEGDRVIGARTKDNHVTEIHRASPLST